jgi:hypothetical protein
VGGGSSKDFKSGKFESASETIEKLRQNKTKRTNEAKTLLFGEKAGESDVVCLGELG